MSAMPITAPVSLSKIKEEFQGPNNLKEYYRGGPYVPINSQSTISTTQNGLAISQFLGASKPAPAPPPAPPPAMNEFFHTGNWDYVFIYVKQDGVVRRDFEHGAIIGNWINGTTADVTMQIYNFEYDPGYFQGLAGEVVWTNTNTGYPYYAPCKTTNWFPVQTFGLHAHRYHEVIWDVDPPQDIFDNDLKSAIIKIRKGGIDIGQFKIITLSQWG